MAKYDTSASLLDNLRKLFNQASQCDVVVVDKDGGSTHCMSWVLSAQSDVFKAMLASGMTESINRKIHIQDVDPECLHHVLESMHTGLYTITPKNFIPMRYMADKYNIKDAIKCCDDYGRERLDREMCFPLLMEGLSHRVIDVVDACAACIVREMDSVCNKTEYLQLSHEAMCHVKTQGITMLFRNDQTNRYACKWFIFGMVKWIEAALEERGKYVMALLEGVDFKCLTPDEVAHLCSSACIQNCRELNIALVNEMGRQGQSSPPLNCLKVFTIPGIVDTFNVQTAGCYIVTAQGGKSMSTGYNGAYIEGSLHLNHGDTLEVVVGKNSEDKGGSACVLLKRDDKRRFVMIAGGGSPSGHAQLGNSEVINAGEVSEVNDWDFDAGCVQNRFSFVGAMVTGDVVRKENSSEMACVSVRKASATVPFVQALFHGENELR